MAISVGAPSESCDNDSDLQEAFFSAALEDFDKLVMTSKSGYQQYSVALTAITEKVANIEGSILNNLNKKNSEIIKSKIISIKKILNSEIKLNETPEELSSTVIGFSSEGSRKSSDSGSASRSENTSGGSASTSSSLT